MNLQPSPQEPPDSSQIFAFVAKMQQGKQVKKEKNLNLLDEQLRLYFISDREYLQQEIERLKQIGDRKGVNFFQARLHFYYINENFFVFLSQQGKSTRLQDIQTETIETYLNRVRPPVLHGGKLIRLSINGQGMSRAAQTEKRELKAFFNRAKESGVIHHNPMIPLVKRIVKLEPKNPSVRTQADCRGFKNHLNRLVQNNLLSPRTAELYYDRLLIFLHYAELQHASNPVWPTEFDDLFADPVWAYEWLNYLENRSPNARSPQLTRGTIQKSLSSLRHCWLFLKSQHRVSETYYRDLKDRFKIDGTNKMMLPGERPLVIEALSEKEESRVFECINQLSLDPILKLRDKAMFIMAIETTIRVDGLNSMQIEEFKELASGVWVCTVHIKRSSKKDGHSLDRLAQDNFEWREWYVSPGARKAIDEYLEATGRNWQSKGPVWLGKWGESLTLSSQRSRIRYWLKVADCKFQRPHVLRHTGIDRLVNKYNLPLATVQEISQHKNPGILIKVYSKRATVDAFKAVNQILPAVDKDEGIEVSDLLLSVGARLNEAVTAIHRRTADGSVFARQHVEELVQLLTRQIERLIKFLGYETTSDVVALSVDDYKRIGDVLQLAGLSYEKVLGYEPRPQAQTVIRPAGRRPKALLN